MCYIYYDKSGELHAAKDEKTAKQFSKNGKYVKNETYDCKNGYVYHNHKEITAKIIDVEISRGLSELAEICKTIK